MKPSKEPEAKQLTSAEDRPKGQNDESDKPIEKLEVKITEPEVIKPEIIINEAKTNEDHLVKLKINDKDEISIPVNPDLVLEIDETNVPTIQMELDWIYGYSGKETKRNLHSAAFTNEIVYSIGPFIILYSIERHAQRIFREHTTFVKW